MGVGIGVASGVILSNGGNVPLGTGVGDGDVRPVGGNCKLCGSGFTAFAVTFVPTATEKIIRVLRIRMTSLASTVST